MENNENKITFETKANYENIINIIDKIVDENGRLYDFAFIDICVSSKTDFLHILYDDKVLCNINYVNRTVYEIEQDICLAMQVYENMYDLI